MHFQMSEQYSTEFLLQILRKFYQLSTELDKAYEDVKKVSSWGLVTNWGANEVVTILANVMVGAFLKKHDSNSIEWLTVDEKKAILECYKEHIEKIRKDFKNDKVKLPFNHWIECNVRGIIALHENDGASEESENRYKALENMSAIAGKIWCFMEVNYEEFLTPNEKCPVFNYLIINYIMKDN